MFPHLTPADRRAFREALVTGYTISTEIEVLNSDDEVLSSLRPIMVEGQVAIDMDAPVNRVVSLTLIDPLNRLGFDSEAIEDGHLYADRQLRVMTVIDADGLSEPVHIPAGCGPIAAMTRAGATLTVEVHDRGAYGMGVAWRSRSWPKGTQKTTVIREILKELMGEPRLARIPEQKERLRRPFNLAADEQPWPAAVALARSMGMRLYYRNDGVPILEHPRESVAWRFRDGEGGSIINDPNVNPDFTTLRNAIEVTGGAVEPKPRCQKASVVACAPSSSGRDTGDTTSGFGVEKRRPRHARAVAPRSHPLSPRRIGRNGAPLFLAEFIEDENLSTEKAVDRVARRSLREGLREGTEVTFDALALYHLEPGDLVAVSAFGTHARFRPRQLSWSLTGGPMSVGYVKALRPNKGAIR